MDTRKLTRMVVNHNLSLNDVKYMKRVILLLENKSRKQDPFLISKEEKEFCRSGNYIQAIKSYRSRNNTGLLESKNVIDNYRHGPMLMEKC